MNKINFNLPDYLNQKRNIINGCLEKILLQCAPQRELTRAMSHSLMAGGKRLRPILCLASAQAAGGSNSPALPAACALEMIHTYSLIHDDLPAMDNDDLRRGIPTCHRAFSEATAILAGDALLTHAFKILACPGEIFSEYPDKSILMDIIGMISDAAGINGMVEGQMMDMQAASGSLSTSTISTSSNRLSSSSASQDAAALPCSDASPLPPCYLLDQLKTSGRGPVERITAALPPCDLLDHLKTLHRLKTGRMILVSVESGAVSVNAGPELIAPLSAYGEKIGLVFQVTDDILNVEGDPLIMGKAAGSDALNEKLTFPSLLGLEESKKYAAQLVDEAISALEIFNDNAMPLRAIADYILKRKR